jgi:hypothetical protein
MSGSHRLLSNRRASAAESSRGALRLPPVELVQRVSAVTNGHHGLLDTRHPEARFLAVTEHFGHEFIGLAVPRPAVVTEMIKEVQELGLLLGEA